MVKKKVLLTGASGSMGGEAFKELLRRRDLYDTVLLLRPSKKNREAFAKYEGQEGLTIVWGDLCNFDDALQAVNGVDHVLHPAAFISPAADYNPTLCRNTNTCGTENIVEAIKRQPGSGDNIRLVSIGSVAEYGDRLPPVQWIKVGDPLKPSVGDYYATTKMGAERAVMESGLRYWAIMRQTFIAIPDLIGLMDPIMFHQPPDTHIELITGEDAGYGLVQTMECPDDFYGRVYNMGGGPSCRILYSDFLERFFKLFGMGDYREILPRNWFGIRNFHCGWYEDSWILNQYLGHWRQSFEDQLKQVEDIIPSFLRKAGKLAPGFIANPVAKVFMKRMADPLKWMKNNDVEKICAFFGSRQAWENIPGWDEYAVEEEDKERQTREDPLTKEYTLKDMQALANSRGGKCLSTEYIDIKSKLNWKCGFGHEFDGTPRLILSGHWCPECVPPPWNWDAIARVDPAIADFYYYNHDKDESQCVEYLYCPHE
jgi:nucleoside-diphosphate-sugar epimerase